MLDRVGLISAYRFDGQGRARLVDWDDLTAAGQGSGFVWIHLQQNAAYTRQWLTRESGLDPVVVEGLLARQSRPRCTEFVNGLMLDLRGINLDPTCEEEMTPLHVWIEARRLITVRLYRIKATRDIREQLAAGHVPTSIGGLLARLTHRLIERVEPAITAIDDDMDMLEHDMVEDRSAATRARLNGLRRRAVALHRYVAPQQMALARLAGQRVLDIDVQTRGRLSDVADDASRSVADLDAIRERGKLIHEEMEARVNDRMQANMYLLSMVSVVFLPLTLLTGLLGINVAGIPSAESPKAFWSVCLILLGLGIAEIWYLRRRYLT
ncbi:CorA family divalent cation transporter [Emcibacter sp. SYSU 3D8]|uniref:CorA family divalent cation transporter n=1 Tax=Emcibacter sp. SYSU 3D8 TaxID=3133969 RepID=UPI0031FE67E6